MHINESWEKSDLWAFSGECDQACCCAVQGEPREADMRATEAGGLPGPGEGAEGKSSEGECQSHTASDLSAFNLHHYAKVMARLLGIWAEAVVLLCLSLEACLSNLDIGEHAV